MTDTTSGDIILKTDRLGRVRMPEERRETILEEYEHSGMSGRAFAAHYGIKYQTFATWRKKRRERGGRKAMVAEGLRLVEAVVDGGPERHSVLPSPAEACLLIDLPGGGRMRVESPVQLRMAAELLAMLA